MPQSGREVPDVERDLSPHEPHEHKIGRGLQQLPRLLIATLAMTQLRQASPRESRQRRTQPRQLAGRPGEIIASLVPLAARCHHRAMVRAAQRQQRALPGALGERGQLLTPLARPVEVYATARTR